LGRYVPFETATKWILAMSGVVPVKFCKLVSR
jgi:hypothetical protein